MNAFLEDIEPMRRSAYDPSTIEIYESYNARIQRFLDSPIGDYLRSVEGKEDKGVAGGGLLGSRSIKEHISELCPGAMLFPMGYLPIWACDGNTILYGLEQEQFYWVAYDSLVPDYVIVVASTGEVINYSEEDVPRALVELSDDVPSTFISDLIDGAYDTRIKELS